MEHWSWRPFQSPCFSCEKWRLKGAADSNSLNEFVFQRGELMAQFSSVKRLFSGDALSVSGFESKKDPFHHHWKVKEFGGYGGAGLRFTTYSPAIKRGNHECKLSFFDSFTVHASSSSDPRNDPDGISYEILLEEPVEFESDDLSGFRGLVLDISYRCSSLFHTVTLCWLLWALHIPKSIWITSKCWA